MSRHRTRIIKYPRVNKMPCVAFPSSGTRLLSWQNSPFCIHHSTHLQQTSSSPLLTLFMSLVFCLPELLQQGFCPSLRAAPHYFEGLPITNHFQSAIKRVFIEDKWKWAALVVTLNRTKAQIETLATRDTNDAWQGGSLYSVMWPVMYLIMSKILLTPAL